MKNIRKNEDFLNTYIDEDLKFFDANLKLPDPTLRDYYKDEISRIIWLDDEVTDSTLDIVKRIMVYNKLDLGLPIEERKPIKILINTPGGDATVMWTIVNAIKLSKTPVWTVNISEAASAGSHILAAGHKKFGLPGSTVLIHTGSCNYRGTREQTDNCKAYYDKMMHEAEEQLIKDTKIDRKTYNKFSPFDWYLSDKEALKYGVIDEIISDLDIILN